MITRTSATAFETNRYHYDSGDCSYANGWAQVDTRQDASYYGIWTNPTKRSIFTYAEGDTNLTECETDEEYVTELKGMVSWLKHNDLWKGIDAGFAESSLTKRFTYLGLKDLLH